MKKVIIAEKPSVAKNIADAFNIKSRKDGYFEGDDYYVTWAFGHLLQLFDAKDYDESMKSWQMDKFPFIPENFRYKVKSDPNDKSKVDKGVAKQIKLIKALIDSNEVDGVITATDQDREGELIALELYMYLKPTKPIYRLLLNEWTPDEVKKGIRNLKKNSDMKFLQDAGISRQLADWIIGINLTSVTTVRYNPGGNKTLNVGRVLLPTLKIIYDRDKEIANFKASTYYKIAATFKTNRNELFEGIYYVDDNEKFEDKSVADNLNKLLKGKKAQIVDKQVEQKKEYPPYLFNLSNLQGYITSKYTGWTSDKVLKVAQSLYEKKFITYPRTGSLALDESLKDKTKKALDAIKSGLPYENQIKFVDNKRIFDNSKVESHSAITPTYLIPTGLSADEQIVYNAIRNRFVMQFMPIAQFEETILTSKVNDAGLKGVFITKGKVQIAEGWRVVEQMESVDTILPYVNEREIVDVADSNVNAVTRKPPKPHTEKTLLRVMETCGKSFKDEEDSEEMMCSILSGFSIGTPATRAETIKKLKDTGYIEAKGKSLICTELGTKLVEAFPVKELFDLEYTGRLEKTLSDIEKGKFGKNDFLNMIKRFTIDAIAKIKQDGKTNLGSNGLGVCPKCKKGIIVHKKSKTYDFYGCSDYASGCKFSINAKFMGKVLTESQIEKLLKDKETGKISGFTKNDGTKLPSAKVAFDNNLRLKLEW